MNQIVLLLRNKTNVTELLSLELVTTSIIIVIREHPYYALYSGGHDTPNGISRSCGSFCGGHRIVTKKNATTFLSRLYYA